MDKKYIGKTLALPKDVADALENVRVELSTELGFKLSLSDAIARLVKMYQDNKGA